MFRALAKCKGLRGTALDIFGRTHERRTERRLIGEYIALVDEFCVSLTDANRDVAIRLARLPDEIRGFGHVKERNLAAAATKREALIAQYSHRGAAQDANLEVRRTR